MNSHLNSAGYPLTHHYLVKELLRGFKWIDRRDSKSRGLRVITLRAKRYYKNLNLLKWMFEAVSDINKSKSTSYGYPFLTDFHKFCDFVKDDGLVTLSFQEDSLIGFNMSKLKKLDSKSTILIAGITIMKKHTLKFSPFTFSNMNYTAFSYFDSRRRGRTLYVSTLVNDGASLEAIKDLTGDTCHPHIDSRVDYQSKNLYKGLLLLSFNAYVKDNFPNASLCLENSIVKSDKILMGFHDSFEQMKHGSKLANSLFIKAWLNDFSKEDILFVGRIALQPILLFYLKNIL